MRRVLLSFAFASLACTEPKAAPIAAPLVIAPIDAGAPPRVLPPKVSAGSACTVAPCAAARGVIRMAVVGTDVYGVPSFGTVDPAPLLRRGKDDTVETQVLADLRPPRTGSINRLVGDSTGLVVRMTDAVVAWEPTQTAARVINTDSPIAEISVDGDTIFIVTGDCFVKRQPRSGGPSTLLGRAPKRTCGSPVIAYDASDVFFTAWHTLYAIPRAGGAARELTEFPPDTQILGLHVDASSVWILATTVVRGPEAALHRMPKRGGARERVRFIDRSGPLHGLAGDATQLFWIEQGSDAHTVMRMAKDGGDALAVAKADVWAYSLVVTPDWIFWGREGNPGKDPPHDVLRLARRGY